MNRKTISIILSICILCILLTITCSSVKIEIEDKTSISKLKRVGLVFRLSSNSRLTKDELYNNIISWMGGHKSVKNLNYISDCNEDVVFYNSLQERFYQLSDNKIFLRYKSIGVIKLYLRKNEAELKNIISLSDLDGLIIHEIYDVISSEMQFMDFDSVLVIVDKNLNILYMDYQSDEFESIESDLNVVKGHLMDKISQRFIDRLLDLEFIKE